MHAEVISIKDQLIFRMLRKNLKAIILRDVEDIEQRLIDDLADLCAIFLWLTFEHIDPNKRHFFLLRRWQTVPLTLSAVPSLRLDIVRVNDVGLCPGAMACRKG